MSEVLVCLLTCIPVLTAAFLGYRIGLERLVCFGGQVALGWFAGILTALSCLSARWFQPFGLVTPILLGLIAAVTVRRISRRPLASIAARISRGVSRPASRPVARRCAGALLGACAGTSVSAFLWIGVALANGALATREVSMHDAGAQQDEATASAFEVLLQTAHHGFVRHVPLIGPLGDEVEALTFILKTDPRLRAELARSAGWLKLAELPSLRAIIEDRDTLGDLDRVRDGSLAAIYRLQTNPLILAFFEEPEVKKLILETRPSELARQLEDLKAAHGVARRR